MPLKAILGLDLGTNSIGWSLIQHDSEKNTGNIIDMGTRIIPMSQDIIGDFEKGNSISQTADRTQKRMARRIRERFLLRRERLHRVLNILGYLPAHYAAQIDFDKRLGKFKPGTQPKLANNKNVFLFKDSFNEMLQDFKSLQPDILLNEKGESRLIPYDWTIYYLRKKAISDKIDKEELAWLLLHFNQKRGYYQLRGEEEEDNSGKSTEFHSLKIIEVTADEIQKGKTDRWYSLLLENGWIYRRSSKTPLFDWKDKTRDFIVTTDIDENGQPKLDKDGNEKRSFRAPDENDWTLKKKKTESDINKSHKTIGAYIYDNLLLNPNIKIKGKLIHTIERHYYRNELQIILKKQSEFHEELKNSKLLSASINELYPQNIGHQAILEKKDFLHLFIEDIIFYQRPLKSKKSTISRCSLEYRPMKNKNGTLAKDVNGKQIIQGIKVIAKSNPLYQEFRIWKWIHDLSIYTKDSDQNVTTNFINSVSDKEKLFEFLNRRKNIEQKPLLKFLLEKSGLKGRALTAEIEKYRWNFVEEKAYPCNETFSLIQSKLEKTIDLPADFITNENINSIWHILYSVNDKAEYEKALLTFATKNNLHKDSFLEAFRRSVLTENDYGAYSEKAIKKLLCLMRAGIHFKKEAFDKSTNERINKILTGEYDEKIGDRVRDKAISLTDVNHFQGLPEWLAKYIIYDRHSEGAQTGKWESSEELLHFLKEFKQHSLRNPIVEQVVTETLRVVNDIWNYYGGGVTGFFSEIHVELGREMKNPKEERERMAVQMAENENTNLRIKCLLAEMLNYSEVENVRPYSPSQQEILKIYEEGALNADENIEDSILKISKTAQPTSAEMKRYKLWMEQKYRSPYTGETIPLNKLFTPAYEIEHIIPKDRYFDDSLSNKVICESAVNKLKSNQTGLEFINNHHGEKVQTGMGKTVRIFEPNEYEDFVKRHYSHSRGKRTKLLLEEIPAQMIERQLNDTRYISKYISAVLSNIVRADSNDDGVNSKNIVPGNGKITASLKQDWGLNDVWNDLILPRFERMNKLTGASDFTVWNENHQKFIPTVPLEFSKNFSKKRIDHRHHALDALIIACATHDHINYMNNANAQSKGKSTEDNKKLRYDLRSKICFKAYNKSDKQDYQWKFSKPWPGITTDCKEKLNSIIVSFKQNLRVINRTNNQYWKWVEEDGEKTKKLCKQTGTNWAIRKPLHKETVSGIVELKHIKVPKGKILTATRKNLDSTFNLSAIESITDTGIQKILKNYLASKGNNPELAFSPEGIEDLNKNIRAYNDGNYHQPILKVRVFETGSKFQLGQSGNNINKYVEAAKGTNLFFGVYSDENNKRSFDTIPLNLVIERQKQGLNPVPPEDEKNNRLLFYLSPNDIVYLPSEDESTNTGSGILLTPELNPEHIYKVVSFTGNRAFFISCNVSVSIVNKQEFTSLNKIERSIDGRIIKESCIKLRIDRLGKLVS